jgi:hypothetical protein
MRLLLFLSRLSLVCCICAVAAMLVPWHKLQWPKEAESTVTVIGLLAYLLCPLVNLCYLVLLLRRRLFARIPRWLVLTNFILLIVLVQYILFQNDTFNS